MECGTGKCRVVASYAPEGARGVLEKGRTARVDAVRAAVEGVGGSVESFYFALGDDDVFVVVDIPMTSLPPRYHSPFRVPPETHGQHAVALLAGRV